MLITLSASRCTSESNLLLFQHFTDSGQIISCLIRKLLRLVTSWRVLVIAAGLADVDVDRGRRRSGRIRFGTRQAESARHFPVSAFRVRRIEGVAGRVAMDDQRVRKLGYHQHRRHRVRKRRRCSQQERFVKFAICGLQRILALGLCLRT